MWLIQKMQVCLKGWQQCIKSFIKSSTSAQWWISGTWKTENFNATVLNGNRRAGESIGCSKRRLNMGPLSLLHSLSLILSWEGVFVLRAELFSISISRQDKTALAMEAKKKKKKKELQLTHTHTHTLGPGFVFRCTTPWTITLSIVTGLDFSIC